MIRVSIWISVRTSLWFSYLISTAQLPPHYRSAISSPLVSSLPSPAPAPVQLPPRVSSPDLDLVGLVQDDAVPVHLHADHTHTGPMREVPQQHGQAEDESQNSHTATTPDLQSRGTNTQGRRTAREVPGAHRQRPDTRSWYTQRDTGTGPHRHQVQDSYRSLGPHRGRSRQD
jgi:hypothetical protein